MGLFSSSKKPKKASSTSPPKERRKQSSSTPPPTRRPPAYDNLPWSAHQPSPQFQPAGYLPAPPGWSPSQQSQQQQRQQPPQHYEYHRPYPPIVVNHYYLSPPPSSNASSASSNASSALCKLTGSAVNLVNDVLPGSLQVPQQLFDDGLPAWHSYGTQLLNQGAALYDQISSRFNDIMTSIDQNKYMGNEKELFTYQPQSSSSTAVAAPAPTHRTPQSPRKGKKERQEKQEKQATALASPVASGSYFSKVELYANSRLPLDLPPLRLYIPTYPLLCLAAQYSDRVYEKPRGSERDAHVDADWKTGAKAMVIKSVPMDHMNTIVFAIRGTATFMDWAVNLNMAPTSPQGFLDDASNLCHAGFLSVARRMVKPVAARLRQLLEENPSRATYSLLITGHSAGGAVAALLYSHMLSTSTGAQSELTALTGAFRRIHCITFGTPPVSLLPLAKPDRPELKKWLFMSFVNEGDPVARADKAYVKSLLELLAAPAPGSTSTLIGAASKCDSKKSKSSSSSKSSSRSKAQSPKKKSSRESARDRGKESHPVWKVPPSTLSSAGRIIVLRSGDPTSRIKNKKTVEERLDEGVIAQVATDEDLRGVIWGDPVCHVMRLYKGRIDTLAVGAVTAAGH